jgi:hypothetical protein
MRHKYCTYMYMYAYTNNAWYVLKIVFVEIIVIVYVHVGVHDYHDDMPPTVLLGNEAQ